MVNITWAKFHFFLSLSFSDIPLKEYIRFLDESLAASDRFIISDLDDTHLFVKPSSLDYVQAKIKASIAFLGYPLVHLLLPKRVCADSLANLVQEFYDKIHFEPPKEQQQY